MKNAERPELFFGLIGAVGSDMESTKLAIRAQLSAVNYQVVEVKISLLIAAAFQLSFGDNTPFETRVKSLMTHGDKAREVEERGDALIWWVVANIRALRNDSIANSDFLPNTAYIIDSLKHPAEVQALRTLYGDNFYAISTYCNRPLRKDALVRKIAASYDQEPDDSHRISAEDLISHDEIRKDGEIGQNLRETFPLADLFIRQGDGLEAAVARFIRLVFGHPFTTPTSDEYWMSVAKSSAFRSADLSRQVGAAIISTNNHLIATDCNEVPKPGGGIFYEGDDKSLDDRDYTKGYDSNAYMIKEILNEFLLLLKKTEYFSPSYQDQDDMMLAKEFLQGKYKREFSNSRLGSLIEFGRIVHAEMHSITEAARLGISTQGSQLFCTTFPCHMCARHIIAAGVSRVVYIEPYPKSLTHKLYSRTTVVDGEGGTDVETSVCFDPFVGVAPRIFERMFSFRPRKKPLGTVVTWNGHEAYPRHAKASESFTSLEKNYSARASDLRAKVLLV